MIDERVYTENYLKEEYRLSDYYFFASNIEILRLIEYTNEAINKTTKRNRYGEIIEGKTGKLVRKYIPIIGQQNMCYILKLVNRTNNKATLKYIEREFENFYKKYK